MCIRPYAATTTGGGKKFKRRRSRVGPYSHVGATIVGNHYRTFPQDIVLVLLSLLKATPKALAYCYRSSWLITIAT